MRRICKQLNEIQTELDSQPNPLGLGIPAEIFSIKLDIDIDMEIDTFSSKVVHRNLQQLANAIPMA